MLRLDDSIVAVGLRHTAIAVRHPAEIVNMNLAGRDKLGRQLFSPVADTAIGPGHVVDHDFVSLFVLLPICHGLLMCAADKPDHNANK